MAYVTQADLTERFGASELAQLTDEVAAQTPDAAEISKACDEASSLIDSYLSVRYAVPLSPVPTLIRWLGCDIARRVLWKDRAKADSSVMAAYEDACKRLTDIAKGVAGLPSAAGALPEQVGAIAYATPSAVFDTTGLLDT